LLWLNGGPGSSSLLGVTLETGPLTFDPVTLQPQLPTYSAWTDDFDVVFIDQPVGTGGNSTYLNFSVPSIVKEKYGAFYCVDMPIQATATRKTKTDSQ
jgi:pimeloyl-ACP methyl ester carboxylesterase